MPKKDSSRKTIRFGGTRFSKFVDKKLKELPGLSSSRIIEVLANKGAEFYDSPNHEAQFREDVLKG